MKTADGKTWTSKAKEQSRETRTTTASTATTKQTKPLNKATDSTKSYDAETTTIFGPTKSRPKMRPTQMLVSTNEGSKLKSWLRDFGTILLPVYIIYMLATHPLIKDVGKPHTFKWTSLDFKNKALYEQNQKLNFWNSVAKYNFLTAMKGDVSCYSFPNSNFEPYQRPDKKGLFQNRAKRMNAQNGEEKPRGIVVKAHRRRFAS